MLHSQHRHIRTLRSEAVITNPQPHCAVDVLATVWNVQCVCLLLDKLKAVKHCAAVETVNWLEELTHP